MRPNLSLNPDAPSAGVRPVRRRAGSLPEQLFISDDSQLTLATCEAVMEVGKVTPLAAVRLVSYLQTNHISVALTTERIRCGD